MNGLATPLVLGAVLLLAAACGLAIWLAGRLAKARGWSSGQARVATLGAGPVGLAIGLAAVSMTFNETAWSPPPRLMVQVPQGYDQPFTIVLADRRADATLHWQGSDLAFDPQVATLAVSASGIVRVRELGAAAGRADLEVVWSDGAPSLGAGGGPAPPASGATSYLLLVRPSAAGQARAEAPFGDDLAKDIARRERR